MWLHLGACIFVFIIKVLSGMTAFFCTLRENEKLASTHYWGAMLVINTLYFRVDKGVSIGHTKDMFFIFISLVSLVLFKRIKTKTRWIEVFIIGFSFFNIWHLGSFNGIHHFIMIGLGVLLFNQAQGFNKEVIFKYFALIGIIASLSVLSGFFKKDYYDILSTTYYLEGNTWIEGKTYSAQYFAGILNGVGHTGALIAMTSIFGGPVVLTMGLLACFKIMLMGTVAPITAVMVALLFRIKDNKMKLASVLVMVLVCSGIYLYNSNFKKVIDREVKQITEARRFNVWKGTLLSAIHKPIIGRGVGFFSDSEIAYARKYNKNIRWKTPHNEFIELFFTYGIIGLVLGVGIFAEAFRRASGRSRAGVGGLIFISTLWFPFHIAIVAPIAIIILSVSISEKNKEY